MFFLVFLIADNRVHAQTGEDALRFTERQPAVGARMIGMAGAGVAGVADYSALFSNPAGLAYFQNSELAGALNAFSTTDAILFHTPGFNGNEERDLRNTRLGSFAYIYKAPTVQGSFVVGLAYNQVHTFGRNFIFGGPNSTNSISDSFLPYRDEFDIEQNDDGSYSPVFYNSVPEFAYQAGAIEFLSENIGTGGGLFYQAVVPGTTIEQFGDVLEDGNVSELNIGGAVEAMRGVMIGVSANLVFGKYRFESDYTEEDNRNQNVEDDYIVILSDGELRGFDYLDYSQRFESNLTGFNVRAGVSTHLVGSLRLGVSLETPTFYSVNEDYFSDMETGFDSGGSLSASQEGDFEYQITTPWRLGGGIAYEERNVLFSADIEMVDWSQLELDSSTDPFEEANRNIRDTLEPIVNVRFGIEYQIGNLSLRGGYALRPDPRDFDIEFGSGRTDRSKTYYAAGLGYRFDRNLQVDFGWIQERFDDLYRPYGDVETTPPVVEETIARNRISVGIRVGI